MSIKNEYPDHDSYRHEIDQAGREGFFVFLLASAIVLIVLALAFYAGYKAAGITCIV